MEEYIVTVDEEGTIRWYQNGKYHRLDGPAIEGKYNYEAWYQDGIYHRLDGPAVIREDGTKIWYQKGRLHRLDGPAVEYTDGYKTWYIDGKEYNQDEFDEITKTETKGLTVEEVSSLLGYKIKIVG